MTLCSTDEELLIISQNALPCSSRFHINQLLMLMQRTMFPLQEPFRVPAHRLVLPPGWGFTDQLWSITMEINTHHKHSNSVKY